RGGWGTLHYEYDDSGNRTLERLNGVDTVYSYDNHGRLQSLSGRVELSFGYDQFGNTTQRGNFGYVYDAEGHLTTVYGPKQVNFGYDGQGHRVVETRPGCISKSIFHYDNQGNRIAESTAAGLMLKEYIVTGGYTVAELDLHPLRARPA